MAKQLIQTILGKFGLELRLIPPRTSLYGCLKHLKKLGIHPATVIDVGVANGTPELYTVYPQAHFALIEPLQEFLPEIKKWQQQYPNLDYVIAAAGRKPGEITLNVHPDLVGSSVFLESENSDVNGIPRTVPMITLDEWCGTKPAPYLIKVDVQGAELEVLAGATNLLKQTLAVVLETSLFQFFQQGPRFYDVIHFMHEHNFVLYDVGGIAYRPLDNALAQLDTLFVPIDSPLQQDQTFASPIQRKQQTQQIRAHLGKNI